MVRRAAPLLLLMIAAPAFAEPVTVVAGDAANVSVTVYRDPNRGEGAMNRRWPRGYALISETRTLRIPAGESVIRFQGVAQGLLPETAIVSGLPKGVREKNRDARLLSPAGLVDAYLKRRVQIRRTNRKTGKVTDAEAVIQSGPGGGVVIETAQGVEALGCAGLPERIRYAKVPADLSPRPTLSVLANSARAETVTIQLTYMAEGFDWSANYVARTRADSDAVGLFAWLTVANGGVQGFSDARLQVVAGRPNKERNARPLARPDPALHLKCWPMDVTSTHPRYTFERLPWPPYGIREDSAAYEDVVVTGSVRTKAFRLASPVAAMAAPPPPPVIASQEALGDLKLYRVPMRVSLAAQSQKQVAMIDRDAARFARVYSGYAYAGTATPQPMSLVLRTRNVEERGLGLPLPAGGVALFAPRGDQDLLIGERAMADRAIGEEIEISAEPSPDVQWTSKVIARGKNSLRFEATITNARPYAINAEVVVPGELIDRAPSTERGLGGWRLPVSVPANGTATLGYAVKR